MTTIRQTFIDDVINVARQSTVKNYIHGAILINGGKIYSRGYNIANRTYVGGVVMPCVHAEMNCLYNSAKLNKKRKIFDLIVVRINDNDKLIESKPCEMCTNAMKKFGIRRIYYSTDSGTIHKENLKDFFTEHLSRGMKNDIKNMSCKNQIKLLGRLLCDWYKNILIF